MVVKILKDKQTATHSLLEGMVVDLKRKDAEKLMANGIAKKATSDDYVEVSTKKASKKASKKAGW